MSPSHRDPGNEGESHAVSLSVLFGVIALAYFYAVDNLWLSTRQMSPIFRYLLMLTDAKTAWLSFGVTVIAAWRVRPGFMLEIVDFCSLRVRLIASASVVMLSLGAIFVYHSTALSMDEYAAVFQAKVFAAGKLTGQVPPSVVDWLIPRGFNGAFLLVSHSSGRAMEAYWPGYALLLAPFQALAMPWLCNALLAGAAILLVHHIALEVTGSPRAAGWAVLFTLASSAFAANAISYYSMQAHLTANLLYVALLLKPSATRAFAAGVVGSLALVLHNPFPHTMFAIPWILGLLIDKQGRRYLLPLLAGYLPLLLILGVGWLQLRESVIAAAKSADVVGTNLVTMFSLPDKGMLDGKIASLVKMWIWAVPGLFVFAVIGCQRHAGNYQVRRMMWSALLTLLGYMFFVFDQGHGWGYRYFQSAFGVAPILAACALTDRSDEQSRLVSFAGAVAILSIVVLLPWQLAQIESVISRHNAQLPTSRRPGNDVFFVDCCLGFYMPDMVQMDPFLRDQDLILFTNGSDRDALLRQENWPKARLVDRGAGFQEWNLGAEDQRRLLPSQAGKPGFQFSFRPQTP